ncbi:hypothetical protein LguiB_026500 [Lonicera macranthoides]
MDVDTLYPLDIPPLVAADSFFLRDKEYTTNSSKGQFYSIVVRGTYQSDDEVSFLSWSECSGKNFSYPIPRVPTLHDSSLGFEAVLQIQALLNPITGKPFKEGRRQSIGFEYAVFVPCHSIQACVWRCSASWVTSGVIGVMVTRNSSRLREDIQGKECIHVILQNEAPTDLYILVSGAVVLIANVDEHNQVLKKAAAGEMFGEIGVLCHMPQPFTVRT